MNKKQKSPIILLQVATWRLWMTMFGYMTA